MSRKCQYTNVGPLSGNTVSHAHNKQRKRFLPNLHKKRIWVKELNRFATVKLSSKALKTISKNGTAELAKLIQDKKVKVR